MLPRLRLDIESLSFDLLRMRSTCKRRRPLPSLGRRPPDSWVIEPARRLGRSSAADYRSHITVESRVKEVEQLVLLRPVARRHGKRCAPARGGRSAGRGTAWSVAGSPHVGREGAHHLRLADVRGRRSFSSNTHSPTAPARPMKAWNLLGRGASANVSSGSLLHRSLLLAMLGRFEEAWQTARESSAHAQALTGNNQAQFLGQIATLEGDDAAAVECWREHCDLLERHGDRAALSTAAPLLGARCARSAGTTRQSRSRNSGGNSPTRATS